MNRSISQQLRDIDQNHINRIQSISETNQFDITSPLEGMVLVNDKLKGGSGYSASTVQDLGFEPTDGATPATATGGRMRRTRATKNLAGSGTSGGGVSGGALLTLQSLDSMHGQPPPGRQKKTAPTASPHKDQPVPMPAQGSTLNGPVGGGTSGGGVSGGRKANARNALVSKIMKENGMSLPQASKHIKDNNLYTR